MTDYAKELLALLYDRTGIDVRAYKPDFIEQQLAARIQTVGLQSVTAYLSFFQSHPDESERLLDALLNAHTEFFRHPLTFELLHAIVLPDMFSRKISAGERSIRAWSAGCATGEESYSVGILLHEHIKHCRHPWNVHVFGTDIRERSLASARQGVYRRERLQSIRYGLLHAYFDDQDDQFRLRETIRDIVSFSAHNLLDSTRQTPPDSIFGSFDLVSCRNVLMYLKPDARERALKKILHSLVPDGILIIGETEDIQTPHARQVRRLSEHCAVYRKI